MENIQLQNKIEAKEMVLKIESRIKHVFLFIFSQVW